MAAKKPPPSRRRTPSAGKVTRVVTVSTSTGANCEDCRVEPIGLDHFEDGINHYIQAHGYTLLHVGQETSTDFEEPPWQSTVAVLGHP